ncbi:MAG: DUF423 domain-containing protein [Desulfobacterales bacterium]
MKFYISLGAIFCLAAVFAGALSAHALKDTLALAGGSTNFDLATRYMFYHGLALMAVGLLKNTHPAVSFQYAGWFFIAGSIMFQGNLFLLALTGIRMFQMLAPAGGLCLMLGWGTIAILALRIPFKP